MNRVRMLSAVVLSAAALLAAGCSSPSGGGSSSAKPGNPNGHEVSPAGDIPDNQAFVAYAPAGAGFSVKVPEGWARTTTAGGAATFTDKLNSVSVSKPTGGQAPPVSGANVKTSVVTRAGGRAALVTYLADSAPDPVTGRTHRNAVERYAFTRAGKRVVLTLSGPKGADNVDPWKIVTDSFRWTR